MIERDMGRALAALREGQNGLGQTPFVRRRLKALQAAGLASYSAADGWRLTEDGRQAIGPRLVAFEARTPKLYRELRIAALGAQAVQPAPGYARCFLVLREDKWSDLLALYEAREIAP